MTQLGEDTGFEEGEELGELDRDNDVDFVGKELGDAVGNAVGDDDRDTEGEELGKLDGDDSIKPQKQRTE